MDENLSNLSDIVRDYRLTTRREEAFTVHFHNDPDAPPSSPQRREVWKKKCNIGRGGQGEVILQVCVEGSRHYTDRAVKKIWFQSSDSYSKCRYERELGAIIKFSHDKYSKYFVKTLGWYTSSTKLYIAMEYLPAGDLYSFVRERRILREEECRQVTCQVLSGLSLMHAEGYAHRDIKPRNILIYQHPPGDSSTLWWVKLGDFGITKRFSPDTASTTTAPIGTFHYMAPELLRESSTSLTRDYQRADMWALGITAFFVSTNSVPFESPASTIEFSVKLGDPFPDGPLDHHQMSQDGKDFIREAINPQPDARPDCRIAMRHAWMRDLFTKVLPPSISDRPSTGTSRASSFDNDTREILTLTSRPSSLRVTVDNATFMEQEQLPAELPRPLETESSKHLNIAASIRHIDMVSSYVEPNAPIDMPGGAGSQPVSIATNEQGTVANIPYEREAVDMPTDSLAYETLELALSNNQIGEMKALIDRGYNAEATSCLGESLLLRAAELGSEAGTRLLIESKVSLEAGGVCGVTPLIEATCCRHLAVAKLLLEQGADVNAGNNAGWTPLMFASHGNSRSLARLLIFHGARLDKRTDKGLTALRLAAQKGCQEVLKILLEAATDVEVNYNYFATPLIAATGSGHLEAVKMLLEKGAKLEEKDFSGLTALTKAIDRGHGTMVELLIEKGADVEAKGPRGENALMRAVNRSSATMTEILIEKGAQIEARDANGKTALIKAARKGYCTVVKVLLEKGAKIEAKDNYRETALVKAVSSGHGAVVKLLLEKGADYKAHDWLNQPCLVIAANCNYDSIRKLLLEKGAKRDLSYYVARMI